MKKIIAMIFILIFSLVLWAGDSDSFEIVARMPFKESQSFKIINTWNNQNNELNTDGQKIIINLEDIPSKNEEFKPLFDIVYTSNYLINTSVEVSISPFESMTDESKAIKTGYRWDLKYDKSSLNGFQLDSTYEDNFNEITVKKADEFYIKTFDIIESGSKTHITNEDESESGTITCTISFGVRWDSESDDYQEFLEKEEITNGEVFKNKITVTVTQSGE